MARTLRKYEEAWNRLKDKQKVLMRVPPSHVAQVKKAVIKEKDNDKTFKLLNEHDDCRLIIIYDEESYTLSFHLKQKFGISDVEV